MGKITVDAVDFVVSYEESELMRIKVFDEVVAWFVKQEVFDKESLMQMDEPRIQAPIFLSELAEDIIKFDVEWK